MNEHRREVRNYIVVSSDHQVQQDARVLHARVMSAEEFSDLLGESQRFARPPEKKMSLDKPLTPEEVAEREMLFTHYNNGPDL